MMVKNLTPHPVVIVGGATYPPAGTVARVATKTVAAGALPDGTPLLRGEYGPVTDLPLPEPDTMLIVSRMVAAASPGRRDLLVPADLVRDAAGAVVGCRGLEVVA